MVPLGGGRYLEIYGDIFGCHSDCEVLLTITR